MVRAATGCKRRQAFVVLFKVTRTVVVVGALVALGAVAVLRHNEPPSATHRLAPFTADSPSGGSIRSADLAGRVAVVNFWASWCGPCREELPKLDSLAATFDSTRVAFVALSDDEDGSAARDMLVLVGGAKHLRVGLGLGRLTARYRLPGLPFTILIDATGRIVRTWDGYGGPPEIAALDSLVRRLQSVTQ